MGATSFTAIFDAQDRMSGVLNGMAGSGNNLESTFKRLAASAAAFFSVKKVVDFGKECVAAAGQFESGMAEVFTLMPNLSNTAMSQMKNDVKDFAKETGTSVNDTTSALYQAISAGVPKENVFGFLETANMAAVGGVSDLTTAVDGLSSVTNAYGADVLSAQQASDLMFTTVKLGKTTFGELAGSLYNVVPTAVGAGVAFSDISASLAAMTAQGIPTSVATTQLRQAIVELSKSGTETDKTFRKLAGKGFKEYIAEGHNLQQAFQLLEKHAAKSGLGINDLFGSVEAGNAVLALTGEGTEKFTQAIQAMGNSAGATETAYNTMEQTAERKLAKMKAQWEVMKVEIGGALADALLPAMDALSENMPEITAAMSGFGDLMAAGVTTATPLFEALVNNIDTVKTSIEGVVIGFASTKIVSGIMSIVGAVSKLKALFSTGGLLAGLSSVLAPAGIFAAGVGVVGALGYGLYKAYVHSREFGTSMNKTADSLMMHTDRMEELSSLHNELGELNLVIKSDSSSTEMVETAKTRIEEIKDLLAEKYDLNINCDTSQLEKAVGLLGEEEYIRSKGDRDSLLMDLEKGADTYNEAKEYVESTERGITGANQLLSEAMDKYYDAVEAGNEKAANEYLHDAEAWRNRVSDLTNDKWYAKYQEEMKAYEENAKKTVEGSLKTAEFEIKNGRDSTGSIEALGRALQYTGESASSYADKLALAAVGMSNFDEVAKNGQNAVSEYIGSFADIGQKLGMTAGEITNFMQSVGAIGGNQHIQITASGDISVLDDATGKIQQLQSASGVNVSVNANGDVSVLDETTGKMQTLSGMGAASVQVNAQGNIDILNEAQQIIGTINSQNAQLTVNGEFSGQGELQAAADTAQKLDNTSSTIAVIGSFDGQEQIQAAVDLGGQVTDITKAETVNGAFPGQEDVAAAVFYQGKLADRTVTYTVNYVQNGTPPANNAEGTMNFAGGLTYVNDQKGVSDPTELIYEAGRLFTVEGKNALVSLRKGAKIFTAAQTNSILGGNLEMLERALGTGDYNALMPQQSAMSMPWGAVHEVPAYAAGTTSSENAFMAGEKGPELIVGRPDHTVFPASATKDILNRFGESRRSAYRYNNRSQSSSDKGNTSTDKHIVIEIKGSGAISTSGQDKNTAVEYIMTNIKPVLLGMLSEEIYSEGERSRDF